MPRAVRITFEYAGLAQPRVISTLHLQKQVIPSERPDAADRRSGFYFDVLSSDGKVLYRRVTSDPRLDVDAPAGDDGQMAAAEAPDEGVFSVVLPDLPGASRVAVWAGRGGEQAKVLLTIPFPKEPV
jgi:hypothetical protein